MQKKLCLFSFIIAIIFIFSSCSQDIQPNLYEINPYFGIIIENDIENIENEIYDNIDFYNQNNNILRLAIPFVQTLNPLLNSDINLSSFFSLIFEPLIIFDNIGDIIANPNLLEAIFLYNDSIRIILKEDIFWEDGERITSNDIEFSINTIRNTQNSIFYNNIKNILSTRIINQNTIDINFLNPSLNSKYIFNFPIIPFHYYSQANMNNPRSQRNMNPLGNGTFRFLEHNDGEFIRLIPNNLSLSGIPNISEINARIISDINDAIYAFERGLIDIIVSDIKNSGRLLASGARIISQFDGNFSEFLIFNFNNHIFQNLNMRRNIYSIFFENVYDYQDFEFENVNINILTNKNENRVKNASLLSNKLEYLGFYVNLEILELEEFFDRALNFEFDILFTGIVNDNTKLNSIFISELLNYSSYQLYSLLYIFNNSRIEMALEIAINDIGIYIIENLPFIILERNKLAFFTSRIIENIIVYDHNIFINISDWILY